MGHGARNGAPASAQHGAPLGVGEEEEEAEEAAGEAAAAARSAALLELACEAVALESGFIEDGDVAIALHSQAAIALPLPNSLRSEATGTARWLQLRRRAHHGALHYAHHGALLFPTGTALWLQLRRRVNVHGTLMLQLVAHKLLVNRSGLDLALRFEGVPADVLASGYELPTTAPRCSWSELEAPITTPLGALASQRAPRVQAVRAPQSLERVLVGELAQLRLAQRGEEACAPMPHTPAP
jgi:hypothetical protein